MITFAEMERKMASGEIPTPEYIVEYRCRDCGATRNEVSKEKHFRSGIETCEPCRQKAREKFYSESCPKLYQDTDWTRLPQPQYSEVMGWNYGPRGLILLGETGKGKTRVAWSLIKKLLTQESYRTIHGTQFYWFDCVGFGHDLAKHYKAENAEDWLEKLATCKLLFLDDLGKLKLTERAEAELFGLIERRCANCLPVLATTNDSGDSLASRMTDNRGPALIRRLREFCDPIQF